MLKHTFPFRQSVHLSPYQQPTSGAKVIGSKVLFVLIVSLVVAALTLIGCAYQGAREAEAPAQDPEPKIAQPRLPDAMQQALVLVPPAPVVVAPPPPPPKAWENKVPSWILRGILRQETKSYIVKKRVVYVDKRRGEAGERGPTQILRAAFDDVKKPGESYWRVETDTDFALEVTVRYLTLLRKQTGSWEAAVRAYNVGAARCRDAGRAYYESVRRLGA